MQKGRIEILKTETILALKKLNSKELIRKLTLNKILLDNAYDNKVMNKREIFYMSVDIFKKQHHVDSMINYLCKKYSIQPRELGISNTLKRIFSGLATLYKKSEVIRISNNEVHLIPDMFEIEKIEVDCTRIIIFEKDTMFSYVHRSNVLDNRTLIICGKGYPCWNTINFLRKIKNISIYGLFDFDPFGIHIYSVYRHKGINVKRIGINLDDIKSYLSENVDFLPLNVHDKKKALSLLKINESKKDLKFMIENNLKLEMDVILESKFFNLQDYFFRKMFDA